jgi:hypothetical protein
MKQYCRWHGWLFSMMICLTPGCASIVSGRHAEVTVNSSPPHAHVAVRNEQGETVATSQTPGTVSLKRSNGLFRKAPRYTVFIEKPGYETARVSVNPKWNPWILGNIALGGVVGLAADSATGAVWRYTPEDINQPLSPISGEYLSHRSSPQVSKVSYDGPATVIVSETE